MKRKIGFASGTQILTLRGEVAIEALKPNDRVITWSVGARSMQSLQVRLVHATEAIKGICIKSGRFGTHLDLHVGPDQPISPTNPGVERVTGRPGPMVAAKDLIDGSTVYYTDKRCRQFWSMEFETQDIVYVNGAKAVAYASDIDECFAQSHVPAPTRIM
ncbi:Hint domain-containing protein [Tateyamaria sp. SN3-11]|uniref:Hint domain-containing protein n=1 Tax=Tateyamaria sp. SN3-11 TaxID=3092147 RepID=UPI0039E7363B